MHEKVDQHDNVFTFSNLVIVRKIRNTEGVGSSLVSCVTALSNNMGKMRKT